MSPMSKALDAEVKKLFSENSKTYLQTALAGLGLPIIFIRQLLGVPEQVGVAGKIDGFLIASWTVLLISAGAGLLYQWLVIHMIAQYSSDEDSDTIFDGFLQRLVDTGHLFYGCQIIMFYCGMVFFAASAGTRLIWPN